MNLKKKLKKPLRFSTTFFVATRLYSYSVVPLLQTPTSECSIMLKLQANGNVRSPICTSTRTLAVCNNISTSVCLYALGGILNDRIINEAKHCVTTTYQWRPKKKKKTQTKKLTINFCTRQTNVFILFHDFKFFIQQICFAQSIPYVCLQQSLLDVAFNKQKKKKITRNVFLKLFFFVAIVIFVAVAVAASARCTLPTLSWGGN